MSAKILTTDWLILKGCTKKILKISTLDIKTTMEGAIKRKITHLVSFFLSSPS